jgi:hypothetical protein
MPAQWEKLQNSNGRNGGGVVEGMQVVAAELTEKTDY